MKPSAIIRKRIEDHFLKPSADGDSTVPTEAWIGEILRFLDQEAERQKAITDGLEMYIDVCDRAIEALQERVKLQITDLKNIIWRVDMAQRYGKNSINQEE